MVAMQWFITVVVIAALGLAAMAAAGGLGEMRKQPVRDYYRQDLPTERPLTSDELEGIRFAITVRGYSMAQVDDLLDRLVAEIALRDARIAELQHAGTPIGADRRADAPDERADAPLERAEPEVIER